MICIENTTAVFSCGYKRYWFAEILYENEKNQIIELFLGHLL